MIIFFILGLLLGVIAVIFAFQNIVTTTVTFLAWQIEGSLALILVMAILTGMVIAFLLTLPELIGGYMRESGLSKRIKNLESDLHKQKELTTFAQKTPPTTEVINHIEEGATLHVHESK